MYSITLDIKLGTSVLLARWLNQSINIYFFNNMSVLKMYVVIFILEMSCIRSVLSLYGYGYNVNEYKSEYEAGKSEQLQ